MLSGEETIINFTFIHQTMNETTNLILRIKYYRYTGTVLWSDVAPWFVRTQRAVRRRVFQTEHLVAHPGKAQSQSEIRLSFEKSKL